MWGEALGVRLARTACAVDFQRQPGVWISIERVTSLAEVWFFGLFGGILPVNVFDSNVRARYYDAECGRRKGSRRRPLLHSVDPRRIGAGVVGRASAGGRGDRPAVTPREEPVAMVSLILAAAFWYAYLHDPSVERLVDLVYFVPGLALVGTMVGLMFLPFDCYELRMVAGAVLVPAAWLAWKG